MKTNEVILHQNKVWTVVCPECGYKLIVKHGFTEVCKCNILWSIVYYGEGIPYVEEEIKK